MGHIVESHRLASPFRLFHPPEAESTYVRVSNEALAFSLYHPSSVTGACNGSGRTPTSGHHSAKQEMVPIPSSLAV
ncbi:hypothetical protein GsuE55_10590 [Geobacillus subterraneus]|uniref:Uncharacterized protein n=1 Tax=Geobacillus subterraneus TaxID=129338 RepID=A0A679FR70_9BACL|nr:hypothetical protein GsuE55_10590 [Geobacillus subterraneus]